MNTLNTLTRWIQTLWRGTPAARVRKGKDLRHLRTNESRLGTNPGTKGEATAAFALVHNTPYACGYRQLGWSRGRCNTCGGDVSEAMWNAPYDRIVRKKLEKEIVAVEKLRLHEFYLRGALETYAQHHPECAARFAAEDIEKRSPENPEPECICGLTPWFVDFDGTVTKLILKSTPAVKAMGSKTCDDCPVGNQDPDAEDHDPEAGPCPRATLCDHECREQVAAMEKEGGP